MESQLTKQCIHCHQVKEFDAFGNVSSKKDGKNSVCKECVNKEQSEYEKTRRRLDPEGTRKKDAEKRNKSREEIRRRGRILSKKYYWANPKKEYFRKLRLKFGMSELAYSRMLIEQNGKCAICGVPAEECLNNKLVVDHDHESGKIRALLCNDCNQGLGRFKDSIKIIELARSFLEKHLNKKEAQIGNSK